LIRGTAIQTLSPSRRPKPVCSANIITGTNPAHDMNLPQNRGGMHYEE
jgi:hypothetical protein